VALAAEAQGVFYGQELSSGEVEGERLPRLVAAPALKLAMLEGEALVEVPQLFGGSGGSSHIDQRVAGGAAGPLGVAQGVLPPCLDGAEPLALMDQDLTLGVTQVRRGRVDPVSGAASQEEGPSGQEGKGQGTGRMHGRGLSTGCANDPATTGKLRRLVCFRLFRAGRVRSGRRVRSLVISRV